VDHSKLKGGASQWSRDQCKSQRTFVVNGALLLADAGSAQTTGIEMTIY